MSYACCSALLEAYLRFQQVMETSEKKKQTVRSGLKSKDENT
jgi:hypothetical protein